MADNICMACVILPIYIHVVCKYAIHHSGPLVALISCGLRRYIPMATRGKGVNSTIILGQKWCQKQSQSIQS